MSKDKNTAFLKGTLSLSISVIITKILGVAFKVPLSYVLGDEGMGYFNTAYAIYGFFYILCTAGVPKSITLVLSKNKSEQEDNIRILRSALILFAKIGLIVTFINIICAPALADFIGNKNAFFSILAIAPSILFVSLSGVLRGYLNTYEKLIPIAISQLIEGCVKLALGLVFAYAGVRLSASLCVISALAISGITVGSAASFLYLMFKAYIGNSGFKTKQSIDFEIKRINKQIIKNALPIALCSSLLNLSATIDLTIIIKRLVLNGASEIYANSIYGNYTTLAVPMFTLVISVLTPIATSYMPRLSCFSAKIDRTKFQSELNKLLCITLILSVPASLAFYFYSFDLLDVLFSVQSSAIGADMLICLSLGLSVLASLTVINTALESQGRIVITVISLLAGAITKFAATYALVGKGEIGILGAPIGTVISYLVSLCISLFALEMNGIKTHAVIKILCLYLIGTTVFYLPYKLIYSTGISGVSFVSMGISLLISCVLYLLSVGGAYIIYSKVCVSKMHKNKHKSLYE